jgi:hypothetical protein
LPYDSNSADGEGPRTVGLLLSHSFSALHNSLALIPSKPHRPSPLLSCCCTFPEILGHQLLPTEWRAPYSFSPPSSYIGEMTFRLVAHVIQYHHSLESVFSSWQFHVYFRCSLARTIIFIWSEKCWVTTCRKSKWLFTMFALHHCAVRTHTQKRERENLLNKSVFNTSARSYPRLGFTQDCVFGPDV